MCDPLAWWVWQERTSRNQDIVRHGNASTRIACRCCAPPFGEDPAFDTVFQKGGALTREQAVSYALDSGPG